MAYKIIFIAVFVSVIIFLYYIYPNIKRPKWERRLISAKYLRDRQFFKEADAVLEKAISENPSATQLYVTYFKNYSTPENMEKLFKTASAGYEKTGNPAAGAVTAWCYIEEGEFDKAEEILGNDEIDDFCYENNLPLKARFFYKKGEYEKGEHEFEQFYKKLFPEAENDHELYNELRPDELITLVTLRKGISKSWKATAKIIPVDSLHEEDSWKNYYEKMIDKKGNFTVETGIYGNSENVFRNRKKELDETIETLESFLDLP